MRQLIKRRGICIAIISVLLAILIFSYIFYINSDMNKIKLVLYEGDSMLAYQYTVKRNGEFTAAEGERAVEQGLKKGLTFAPMFDMNAEPFFEKELATEKKRLSRQDTKIIYDLADRAFDIDFSGYVNRAMPPTEIHILYRGKRIALEYPEDTVFPVAALTEEIVHSSSIEVRFLSWQGMHKEIKKWEQFREENNRP